MCNFAYVVAKTVSHNHVGDNFYELTGTVCSSIKCCLVLWFVSKVLISASDNLVMFHFLCISRS